MSEILSSILSRRAILASGFAASFATSALAKNVAGEPFPVPDNDDQKVDYKYRKQIVEFETSEKRGTIVVQIKNKFLHVVLGNGKAVRFGIGTGRYGDWTGTSYIGRMEKWPIWTPTPDHISRRPDMKKWLNGMPGGLKNPMGARAIYLYQNDADTTYRIHGTDLATNVGTRSTAGCFAMFNADVIWLFDRVKLGTKVVAEL